MTDQSRPMRERIANIILACDNECSTCKWFNSIVGCQEPSASEIIQLIKSEYPIMFREEADFVGRLLEKGWRWKSPEEAEQMVAQRKQAKQESRLLTDEELSKVNQILPEEYAGEPHWFLRISKKVAQAQDTKTLRCLKDAGWVKLAKDQTLPEIDNDERYWASAREAQNNMLKAGWRKAELQEQNKE